MIGINRNLKSKLIVLSSYLNNSGLKEELRLNNELIKSSAFRPSIIGEDPLTGEDFRSPKEKEQLYEIEVYKTPIRGEDLDKSLDDLIDSKYKRYGAARDPIIKNRIKKLILDLNEDLVDRISPEDSIDIKIPKYRSMHWGGAIGSFIYILKIKKDDQNYIYYVGETTNIYRRYNQHRYLYNFSNNDNLYFDYKQALEDNIIQDFSSRGAKVIRDFYSDEPRMPMKISLEYIELLKKDNKSARISRERELFFQMVKLHGFERVRGSDWSIYNYGDDSNIEEGLKLREDFKESTASINRGESGASALPPDLMQRNNLIKIISGSIISPRDISREIRLLRRRDMLLQRRSTEDIAYTPSGIEDLLRIYITDHALNEAKIYFERQYDWGNPKETVSKLFKTPNMPPRKYLPGALLEKIDLIDDETLASMVAYNEGRFSKEETIENVYRKLEELVGDINYNALTPGQVGHLQRVYLINTPMNIDREYIEDRENIARFYIIKDLINIVYNDCYYELQSNEILSEESLKEYLSFMLDCNKSKKPYSIFNGEDFEYIYKIFNSPIKNLDLNNLVDFMLLNNKNKLKNIAHKIQKYIEREEGELRKANSPIPFFIFDQGNKNIKIDEIDKHSEKDKIKEIVNTFISKNFHLGPNKLSERLKFLSLYYPENIYFNIISTQDQLESYIAENNIKEAERTTRLTAKLSSKAKEILDSDEPSFSNISFEDSGENIEAPNLEGKWQELDSDIKNDIELYIAKYCLANKNSSLDIIYNSLVGKELDISFCESPIGKIICSESDYKERLQEIRVRELITKDLIRLWKVVSQKPKVVLAQESDLDALWGIVSGGLEKDRFKREVLKLGFGSYFANNLFAIYCHLKEEKSLNKNSFKEMFDFEIKQEKLDINNKKFIFNSGEFINLPNWREWFEENDIISLESFKEYAEEETVLGSVEVSKEGFSLRGGNIRIKGDGIIKWMEDSPDAGNFEGEISVRETDPSVEPANLSIEPKKYRLALSDKGKSELSRTNNVSQRGHPNRSISRRSKGKSNASPLLGIEEVYIIFNILNNNNGNLTKNSLEESGIVLSEANIKTLMHLYTKMTNSNDPNEFEKFFRTQKFIIDNNFIKKLKELLNNEIPTRDKLEAAYYGSEKGSSLKAHLHNILHKDENAPLNYFDFEYSKAIYNEYAESKLRSDFTYFREAKNNNIYYNYSKFDGIETLISSINEELFKAVFTDNFVKVFESLKNCIDKIDKAMEGAELTPANKKDLKQRIPHLISYLIKNPLNDANKNSFDKEKFKTIINTNYPGAETYICNLLKETIKNYEKIEEIEEVFRCLEPNYIDKERDEELEESILTLEEIFCNTQVEFTGHKPEEIDGGEEDIDAKAYKRFLKLKKFSEIAMENRINTLSKFLLKIYN